jgi:hypothetical protein
MDHPVVVAALTLIGLLIIYFLVLLALTGGKLQRIFLEWQVSLRTLRDEKFAAQVAKLLAPPEPEKPAKPDGTPLRVLTLLQREGRLLDFLMEDIASASNEDIGAAVREIHQKCQDALKEHLDLQPVIAKEEGEPVDVPAGFDPSAVQLTGNVTGQPPFKGKLIHPGWKVAKIKIAKPAPGVDELVVQPAEVEMP